MSDPGTCFHVCFIVLDSRGGNKFFEIIEDSKFIKDTNSLEHSRPVKFSVASIFYMYKKIHIFYYSNPLKM